MEDILDAKLKGELQSRLPNSTLTAGKSGGKNRVFISYNKGSWATMFRLAERLKIDDYAVWIDIDKTITDKGILDVLAKALQEAAVVLICATEGYENSIYCRAEALYAFALGKKIIPLMMESNRKPRGWLAMVCVGKFYVDFGQVSFTQAYEDIRRALGDLQVYPALDHSAQEATPPHKTPEKPKALVTTHSVYTWSADQTSQWFTEHGLDSCKEKFSNYNGKMLASLVTIRHEDSSFFYRLLQDKFELEGVEILKMLCAIDTL